ncbi:capsule assembly Wzi family protein [Spirosoma fluminis]
MHLYQRRWLLALIASTFLLQASVAQPIRQPDQYSVELGGYVSSSVATPFWLRANQYGIVSYQSPASTIRVGISSDYDTTYTATRLQSRRKFDIGYGINVVANFAANPLSYEKAVLLPEAYVKSRYGIFEVYAGRRRERFGLADSTLSSGSYAWSGNAMPIPKIQVSIPTFTPIGFTKGWVAIQGTYAHGFLSANGFIRNTMLHQKSLYFRLGREKDVLRVYGGFNHQVIWGGRTDKLKGTGLVPDDGRLPSSLLDYYYVVIGDRFSRADSSVYTNFEITNRVGNHLGSIDVGAEIDLVRHTIFIYRQNIYEDGSLFSLINIADGLNGIRIRRNNPKAIIRDILVEFLNTTSQGGPEFIIDDPKRRGKDNYFNHQQYRDGWAYRQHTIGTPFVPPALGPNNEYPSGTFTLNNRVRVLHIGIAGNLPILISLLDSPIAYQAKLSFSQNLGTYDVPYSSTRNQFSGYLGVMVPLQLLGGLELSARVAADAGTLYKQGVGAYFSIRKTWKSTKVD